ncbi:MAG TPA: radical SAM protein [Candidatus Woesearchaeota archaeon]|nr:radical SAM protein [Candidatus Woesearchaeota archaeon]
MRKIFLVTDYACNSACISCAKKLDEKGRLNLDQIIEKIDLIKPSKDDYIEISGGEPTLREDLFDICHYLKSNHDTNLIILSNGRKFKDKSFSKQVKEVGVDRVMTTFYSPYEEKHDMITQRKGSFLDTLQGLKNLEEIELPISVKTIVLKQNYQELSDFVSFAYDTFHSAWVSIHGLIMRGHANDNREQLVARYKEMKPYIEDALDEAIRRDKNLGVFIIPSCTLDPSYWKYLSINWKEMTKEMIYISPEETIFGNLDVAQPDYCNDCLINKNCSWAWESAWKEYIDMFGTSELDKITKSKLRYQ